MKYLRQLLWGTGSLILPLLLTLIWFPLWLQPTPNAPPYDVIINEWSQGNSGSKEWVELLVTSGPADLRGWDLGDSSAGDLTFSQDPLWQAVPAGTLILIYNGADPDTALPPNDINPADCRLVIPDDDTRFFSGNFPQFANSNIGDNPHLRDSNATTIHDFSIAPGGSLHPNGQEGVQYQGNTAVSVTDPNQWLIRPASVATPNQGNNAANSAWINTLCSPVQPPPQADLTVTKTGPATALLTDTLTYQLTLQNLGTFTSSNTLLTDTLPHGLIYLTDNAPFFTSHPTPHQILWHVGDLPPQTTIQFQLTTTMHITAVSPFTNHLTISTPTTETTTLNNHATATTLIQNSPTAHILIEAIAYYGYEGNADEAIRLRNVGPTAVNLSQWQLTDGTTTAVLPPNLFLQPNQTMWLANDGIAFQRQFGFPPTVETIENHANIPNLSGNWPGFANSGDEVLLFDQDGLLIDAVIYGTGDTQTLGWSGTAVFPYQDPNNQLAVTGQILYRHPHLPDTNTALDWAQTMADPVNSRKVQYPGWELDTFYQTVRFTETAVVTVAVAPDNAYHAIINQINRAQHAVQIETHTFENLGIADSLIQAQQRGVSVTILLEGNPPGGLSDQGRYVCEQLEAVGGACWFMINDPDNDIYDRYRFIHAKFILIDDTLAIVGSENLSPNSLPYDDKSDGTWGRRGVVLMTNASSVINHLRHLFNHDLDPQNHQDLFRWQANHDSYGSPPLSFHPITLTGGVSYTVRYPTPSAWQGDFSFEIVQSPENSLQTPHSLIGLIEQAGNGDQLLVQQLTERPYWGEPAIEHPNPRLEAYIAAARRGATVYILLDAYFNDSRQASSNSATCHYVEAIAQQEYLQLHCALGNPAGLGIHNKMVLVQAGNTYYSHVGSINGTELSSKGNRELALQIESEPLFNYLANMFWQDWPWRLYFPLAYSNYLGTANHVLISEVLYDPPGVDDAEFIELVNPTTTPIDISGYRLGDAELPTDFEDMRYFPQGTIMQPKATIIIATSSIAFAGEYGRLPHFEILETDPTVPQLLDDPAWGDPATFLQLGNSGDQVILRDPNGNIIDMLIYGTKTVTATKQLTDNISTIEVCPLVSIPYSSLERFPYWRDTNNCSVDFREWPFPSPGYLPK